MVSFCAEKCRRNQERMMIAVQAFLQHTKSCERSVNKINFFPANLIFLLRDCNNRKSCLVIIRPSRNLFMEHLIVRLLLPILITFRFSVRQGSQTRGPPNVFMGYYQNFFNFC